MIYRQSMDYRSNFIAAFLSSPNHNLPADGICVLLQIVVTCHPGQEQYREQKQQTFNAIANNKPQEKET